MSDWYIEKRKEDPMTNKVTTFLCHKTRGDIMSDCELEFEDRKEFFNANPCGEIIVGGLGLGVVSKELLKLDCVTGITIIEKEQEVIDLVSQEFENETRVSIVKGDARSYIPESSPDFVYMDIWDDDLDISYQDRLDTKSHWEKLCENCFLWAMDRSERHAFRRIRGNKPTFFQKNKKNK